MVTCISYTYTMDYYDSSDNNTNTSSLFSNASVRKVDFWSGQRSFIQYLDKNYKFDRNNYEKIVIGIDPAKTSNETSNETGIVVVGLNKNDKKIHVIEDRSGNIQLDSYDYYKLDDKVYQLSNKSKKDKDGNRLASLTEVNKNCEIKNNGEIKDIKYPDLNGKKVKSMSQLTRTIKSIIEEYNPNKIVVEDNTSKSDVLNYYNQIINSERIKNNNETLDDLVHISSTRAFSDTLGDAKTKRAGILFYNYYKQNIVYHLPNLKNGLLEQSMKEEHTNSTSPDRIDALYYAIYGLYHDKLMQKNNNDIKECIKFFNTFYNSKDEDEYNDIIKTLLPKSPYKVKYNYETIDEIKDEQTNEIQLSNKKRKRTASQDNDTSTSESKNIIEANKIILTEEERKIFDKLNNKNISKEYKQILNNLNTKIKESLNHILTDDDIKLAREQKSALCKKVSVWMYEDIITCENSCAIANKRANQNKMNTDLTKDEYKRCLQIEYMVFDYFIESEPSVFDDLKAILSKKLSNIVENNGDLHNNNHKKKKIDESNYTEEKQKQRRRKKIINDDSDIEIENLENKENQKILQDKTDTSSIFINNRNNNELVNNINCNINNESNQQDKNNNNDESSNNASNNPLQTNNNTEVNQAIKEKQDLLINDIKNNESINVINSKDNLVMEDIIKPNLLTLQHKDNNINENSIKISNNEKFYNISFDIDNNQNNNNIQYNIDPKTMDQYLAETQGECQKNIEEIFKFNIEEGEIISVTQYFDNRDKLLDNITRPIDNINNAWYYEDIARAINKCKITCQTINKLILNEISKCIDTYYPEYGNRHNKRFQSVKVKYFRTALLNAGNCYFYNKRNNKVFFSQGNKIPNSEIGKYFPYEVSEIRVKDRKTHAVRPYKVENQLDEKAINSLLKNRNVVELIIDYSEIKNHAINLIKNKPNLKNIYIDFNDTNN